MFDVVRSSDPVSDWKLVGELDLATAGDLNTVILPWLDGDESNQPIRFDVSELRFIDSTGLRTVYSLSGPPFCRTVILRNPSEGLWQVLAILGFVSNGAERPTEVVIGEAGRSLSTQA